MARQAVDLVSGPAGVAAVLRRGLLDKPGRCQECHRANRRNGTQPGGRAGSKNNHQTLSGLPGVYQQSRRWHRGTHRTGGYGQM
jgi:mono/diheme cytochrome c family protein